MDAPRNSRLNSCITLKEHIPKSPGARRRFLPLFPLLAVFGWLAPAAAQTNLAPLTNASAILALPAERAYGRPVQVRGVVTAAQPDLDWSGRFFIQDATAGIFVENIGTNQPEPGDLLEVSGLSHPGGYAPIITEPRWRKLGTAPLPAAKSVPIEQLMAGIEDSQRVEISGIVRAFRHRGAIIVFELASGGYRLTVNTPPPPGLLPQNLIGAQVRVRGTAATFFSGKLRHLITVTLHVPRAEDFQVEKIAAGDPFAEPVTALDSLAQYRSEHELSRRVHVKGLVTYQRPGEDLFLQDATGGMQVKSRMLLPVAPGDLVEAVGFPNFEQFLPVLQDAVFRKVGVTNFPPATKPVTIAELAGGFRHADLVSLEGKVLDSTERWVNSTGGGPSRQRRILTLQNSNFLVSVECPISLVESENMLVPVGGIVEVTGICLTKISEDGRLQGVQILLPTPRHIRLLAAPSWWTPQRLLLSLVGLISVLLVAVSWIVMISRKNAALQASIREKEQAQISLQHANDRLEERVKERSEQLKLQITARKEAEVQFQAVLNERTRLAQELHDTLEQTLTGIALQMDTAAKFSATDSARAELHRELARHLVTQSQAEVRGSVWDLRSRSPEPLDFAGLLRKISSQVTQDTEIQVAVKALGRVRPLPELIEDNLLRMAQEALTNIIKHARASEAVITLDYGPQNVILTITDNGAGFVVQQQPGPREGHFGLLGISERARRLRGQVTVSSEPGRGTTVTATIPVAPAAGAEPLEPHFGAEL